MDEDFQNKHALKIHGLKGRAFSDSDSDEGMDTEDYKEYEPPPIDIENCHVYTVTESNQCEEGNAVAANPWHNIPQKTAAIHQNVPQNEENMSKEIIADKEDSKINKKKKKSSGQLVNLNQLKGCLQLSEKSSHIYDIIKAHNQFPTVSESSKKEMEELEKKFKNTKPYVHTTGPVPVSIKDLVRALVVAFLFKIDVQDSTIDMFEITTNICVLENNLKLHFRNMMTQIMITPDNVLFFEFYQKLERLVLQRYQEVHQTHLNGQLSRTVSPIDMLQNQVKKDDNSITKQDTHNQVLEYSFDNIQVLDDVLQLSSEAVQIYFSIKKHSQLSSTVTQKRDSPLISEKIQMHLENSFLFAKPCPDWSVYTKIKELVRAITVALLFGINVSKLFIHHLKTKILQIDIVPCLLEIEVRVNFREIMVPLQVPPEDPIFFKLYTKLEDVIIQRNVQYSTLLHDNVGNTKKNTEVSKPIGKISIRKSVLKRLSDLKCLKANLNLSKIAAQIYIIIRSENQFVCHKDRIFSAISDEHRRLIEKQYSQSAGKTICHKSDLPSELSVKDLVRAVSVAFLFEIDIKTSINDLCKFEVNPDTLKREVKLHFKQMMTHFTIIPNDQIFSVLYKKVEKFLIPEVIDLIRAPSLLQLYNPLDPASNFYSCGCDQNIEDVLPTLDNTYSAGNLLPDLCLSNNFMLHYAPTNIQNNLTSYKVDSQPKSTGPFQNYDKDFPSLSETSRKTHRTQIIDNTQETEVPNLNLTNNVARPGDDLNVTNRVVLPSTGAIPKENILKEKKKRKRTKKKGNQSNDLQQLLLDALNKTSKKVEVKNTEDTEKKMVLPNYSNEAVSINQDCSTEDSGIIDSDEGASIWSQLSDTPLVLSDINENETIIQPTIIESQSMSDTQNENNMENGYNSEHPDDLSYNMSPDSVTEHHSTNDSVSRLHIQTPSTYSREDVQFDNQPVETSTELRKMLTTPTNNGEVEIQSKLNAQKENRKKKAVKKKCLDNLSSTASKNKVRLRVKSVAEINDSLHDAAFYIPSLEIGTYPRVIDSDDGASIWSQLSDTPLVLSEINENETIIQPTIIESQSMSDTHIENNRENGYNREHPDGLTYSMSSHSVTEADIDRYEHHSTNEIPSVSGVHIQAPSTLSLEDVQFDNQPVETSTGVIDSDDGMSDTQNENNMENGYNREHSDGLTYSMSSHSVTEANIDRYEHHSTNEIPSVSGVHIQAPSTLSSEDVQFDNQLVETSTDTTDNTIELNTTHEEYLPGISHVEENVHATNNALVPYTNCESVMPEDLLLSRIRYLLILYFSIVLGTSFLDWILANSFSILMVILVVLFVK
ncbi:unnamed protein product [Diabrotica balteata]|uniref:Uncharacterized protein n=1 Tax=Diabrotica balteata TaxID=107213 RepID=A0A9P0DVY0_DIABA|nr:unnamed protein product [Diabrotica balteata]